MQKIFLSFILLLIAYNASAQKGQTKRPLKLSKSFKSSFGIGGSVYNYRYANEFTGQLNYAPQLDLTNKYSDYSISLNTQLSAGYHVKTKNDTVNFLYADFPLIIQMNVGHLASKDFFSDYGFFIGAGYDVNYFRNTLQYTPAFTTGFRFWLLGKSFTLRYLYTGLSHLATATPLHTLTLNLNVGAYLENVKANNKVSNFMKSFKQH